MTHDELLKTINKEIKSYDGHLEVCKEWVALRAVVKLHKPIQPKDLPNDLGICLTCTPLALNFYEAIRYPCPTIQAIEEQLK